MQDAHIGKIVYTDLEIQEKVKNLAKKIALDYGHKEIIIISVLKSSIYFAVDLSRYLSNPIKIDFLEISRYLGEDNSGIVRITRDLDYSIKGKDVIILDTIINTGLTHSYLLKNLQPRQANSLYICTLLNNNNKRLVELPIRYQGFEITDKFLIGYGLDYQEKYRSLPYIAEYKD